MLANFLSQQKAGVPTYPYIVNYTGKNDNNVQVWSRAVLQSLTICFRAASVTLGAANISEVNSNKVGGGLVPSLTH